MQHENTAPIGRKLLQLAHDACSDFDVFAHIQGIGSLEVRSVALDDEAAIAKVTCWPSEKFPNEYWFVPLDAVHAIEMKDNWSA